MKEGVRSTIRKDPQTIQQILDELDSRVSPAAVNARESERYSYRIPNLLVELTQPGGSTTAFSVPSRNISRDGIGFVSGHFVYPGTECRVHLPSWGHHKQVVTGRVVRCRYLEGTAQLYEVGVRFHTPVNVRVLHLEACKARVLLIDDDVLLQDVVRHVLAQADVDLVCARGGEEGLRLALDGNFDLVLLDLEMPPPDGFTVMRKLREAGYYRPVCAVTALEGDDIREKALAAGCDEFLAKPVPREALLELVERFRPAPIYSTLGEDPQMGPVVERYVYELPEHLRKLEAAYRAGDYETVARVVRTLKGNGAVYGFQAITDAAAHLEKTIAEGQRGAELRQAMAELMRVCQAARARDPLKAIQNAPQR